MDKTLEIAKVTATGTFKLFVGKVASSIVLAVGTIVLGWLILPADYGLYTVALIPSMMMGLFQDWGVSSAITRYVAHFKKLNKDEDVYDIIFAGVVFKIVAGLILSFISLLSASFIASNIFDRQETTNLILFASITIFSKALLTTSQSSFIGFERMELSSLAMVCQSVVQSVFSPLLIFLGYGALGAVVGYTFSFLAAGAMGIVTLYFLLFRKLRRAKKHKPQFFKTLKELLRYGVPLSISSILTGFLGQFYGFMMASFVGDVMIGNYQIARNFSVILTFFIFPISTVLFPAFAKLDPRNEPQLLKTIFTSSIKYTSLLLVPATLAVIVLSEPLVSTLFGEKWIFSPFFLMLYVSSNLLAVFGSMSLTSFLAGVGETSILMKLSFLTLFVGVPMGLLLIPTMQIIGVIIGTILAGLPSMFLGLYWIRKHYGTRADFQSSGKILVASAVAALVTYAILNFLSVDSWIRLVIGGSVFLAIYICVAPLVGALTKSDIKNLRVMMSGLGGISKLANIPLAIAEKMTEVQLIKRK